MKYHIWTEGCQMNLADSQRVASELEKLGYRATRDAESADVVVLNTCVVRQSAEDKAYSRLMSLKPLKQSRPELVLGLMGCLVGVRNPAPLQARFPFVDVFLPPSDPTRLVELLHSRDGHAALPEDLYLDQTEMEARYRLQDGESTRGDLALPLYANAPSLDTGQPDFVLPAHQRGTL